MVDGDLRGVVVCPDHCVLTCHASLSLLEVRSVIRLCHYHPVIVVLALNCKSTDLQCGLLVRGSLQGHHMGLFARHVKVVLRALGVLGDVGRHSLVKHVVSGLL